MRRSPVLRCSFCETSQDEVVRLISGPGNVFICDSCIRECQSILCEDDEVGTKDLLGLLDLPTPDLIKSRLDEYVIGQEKAKKSVAVAVYNHYKRISFRSISRDVDLDKSNILFIGPTGSGKTLIARTLAKILKVPFAMADATSLTEAGYVGSDPESILSPLLAAAEGDIEKAEKGIIFLDEVDKIARRSGGSSAMRDVSGEGVQQALLKILEGSEVLVPPSGGKLYGDNRGIPMNTKNILFICGGSFSGLEDIIIKRKGSTRIGFDSELKSKTSKDKDIFREVTQDDLLKFGMIPEFIGRVPVIASLAELDKEDFRRILTEPKNAIVKQYKKLFQMDGLSLEFTDEGLDFLIETTLKQKIGARGLRSTFEKVMLEVMYDSPAEKQVSDLATIVVGSEGKIEKRYSSG